MIVSGRISLRALFLSVSVSSVVLMLIMCHLKTDYLSSYNSTRMVEKDPSSMWAEGTLDSQEHFTVPWSHGISSDTFKRNPWYQSLLNFTQRLEPNETVFMVCSDKTFKEALLNWLVSTLVWLENPPSILVVSNQAKVCSFLKDQEVPVECLSVSAAALLDQEGMNMVKGHQFRQVLVVRMSVLRILNHLGHNVVNMDTDAIMLRNPIPVLEWNGDSDVVGTYGGKLPPRLFGKWGVVVCMGAVMIRSTPKTGAVLKISLTVEPVLLY